MAGSNIVELKLPDVAVRIIGIIDIVALPFLVFSSIILLFVSISLLKGNFSSMHGKVFNNTNDKVGYAKASRKPVVVMAFGIAVSGIVAVMTSKIIISVIIVVCVAAIVGIWFINIQKRFP